MICRNCSAEIDDNSKKCPSCGKDPKKRNSGSKAGTLLTILLILSLGVNSYFISANFDEIKRRAEPLFASISQSVSSLFKNDSSGTTTTAIAETTSAQTEPGETVSSAPSTETKEETSATAATETESSATETTEKTSESENATETSAQTSAKEEETSAAKKPKAEKEISKAAASKPQSTKESSDSAETVYVTASGKRYHRKNCSYISNSTSKRGVSLREAAREGYSACSRCKP